MTTAFQPGVGETTRDLRDFIEHRPTDEPTELLPVVYTARHLNPAEPDLRVSGYKGRHRKTRPSAVLIAVAAVAALFGIACATGAPSGNGVTGDTQVQPAATAPAKTASGFGEGTYEVGADIKPGKYKTTVPADAVNCYWARLSSLDTSEINDNGNLSPGAKGLIQVTKSDKAVELRGDCRWTAVK